MAAIRQLISQVPDPARRERLQQEADALTHGRSLWRLQRLQLGQAHCLHLTRGEAHTWPLDPSIVVRRFGEPIFPSLVPMDRVANGPADAPRHTLIEADN